MVEAEPIKTAVVKNLLRFKMRQLRNFNYMKHTSCM